MIRIFSISIFLFCSSILVSAQKSEQSKWTMATSKTNAIVKKTVYNMGNLFVSQQVNFNSSIVTVVSDGAKTMFFKLDYEVPAIEYTDLVKLVNAIPQMKAETIKEKGEGIKSTDGFWRTPEGFEVGYQITTEKTRWVVDWESKGGGNTTISITGFEAHLKKALKKMETL